MFKVTQIMCHLAHITERLRQQDAKWDNGTQGSASGFPSNFYVSITSGEVYQLHKQDFPAMSMPTDLINVVNNPISPYIAVDNLNGQTLDANGDPLANFSFSFVVWGVQNSAGDLSHMMCNLPIGTYAKNDPDAAISDANNYSVYTIPKDFQGVGFLIARFTLTLDTGGTVWTLHDTEDLRGALPNTTAGGGAGGAGVTDLTGLNDTPSSYTGEAGDVLRVNSAESAMDFTSVLRLGGLKSGTLASPPTGLVTNELWEDTTDSATHPAIRISKTTT